MKSEIMKEEVINTIVEKIGVEKETLYRYGSDRSLFDISIGLKSRDLLALFFELQRKYDIIFEEKDILEKRFDYLDNMVEAIIEKQVSG